MSEIALHLAQARHDYAEILTDECVVLRPTGERGTNPDFTTSTEYHVLHVRLPCRISGDRPHEQAPHVGGATYVVQRHIASLPANAGPFEVGDILIVTRSRTTSRIVGNGYRLAGLDERSHQTTQRMFADILQGAEIPPLPQGVILHG